MGIVTKTGRYPQQLRVVCLRIDKGGLLRYYNIACIIFYL